MANSSVFELLDVLKFLMILHNKSHNALNNRRCEHGLTNIWLIREMLNLRLFLQDE